jgi:hypothetical protein
VGDPTATERIYLKGLRFNVTTNLASALQHIRFQDQERTLWVDAVCINQKDIAERNHQVTQMQEIYLTARQAVVWLGNRNAESALNCLRKIPSGRNAKKRWAIGMSLPINRYKSG